MNKVDMVDMVDDVEAQLADAVARQRRSWRLPRTTALMLGLALVTAGFLGGVYTTKALLTPTTPATTPQQQFPGGGGFPGGGNFPAGGPGGGGGAVPPGGGR